MTEAYVHGLLMEAEQTIQAVKTELVAIKMASDSSGNDSNEALNAIDLAVERALYAIAKNAGEVA